MEINGNAVGYERFSTDNQSSTEEQEGVNNDLAEDYNLTIVRHFADEAITRSIGDREGLLEMFEFIETHPQIKYIIVNELERLTAGVSQRAAVTKMCKRLGITIVTEDMDMIDPHDEDKMHEADQRAVASAGEVLKIRRRTRRSLKQKARRGVAVMRPPYGTAISSGVLSIKDDEIRWLRQIFAWGSEGVPLGEIRRRLEAEGVPTKSGKPNWSTTAIRGILDNPFYKGEITWGRKRTLRDENGRKYREERPDGDPEVIVKESPLGPLVPIDQWNKVRELKEANAGTRVRQAAQVRLFDHLLFCGRCGYKMYVHDNMRRTPDGVASQLQYSCHTPNRKHRKPLPEHGNFMCSTPHSVSLRLVLAAIAGEAAEGLAIDGTVTVGGDGGVARKRARLTSDKAKAKLRIANAQDLALDGLMSKDKLRGVIAENEEKIANYEAALADLDVTGGITLEPFEGTFSSRLSAVAERLKDESRPMELRRELLADAGLHRMYLDKPVLRLHFRE